MMLSELHKEMHKQSKQLAGSKDETSEMRKQLEKLTESHNDQTKKLEKLTESLEKLNESHNDLRKQLELHTNAPRCCLFSMCHHIFCFQGIARIALLVKLLLNFLHKLP